MGRGAFVFSLTQSFVTGTAAMAPLSSVGAARRVRPGCAMPAQNSKRMYRSSSSCFKGCERKMRGVVGR